MFCHPIPTRLEFAGCCAPALEAGESVSIHLIFGAKDLDVLTAKLNHQYPDRSTLTNVYRKMRELFSDGNGGPVPVAEVSGGMDIDGPEELIISNCAAILEEIDLVRLHQVDGKAAISLPPTPKERRDLQESQRYAAGNRIREEWAEFSSFTLKKTAEDIHRMLLEMIS